MQVTVVDRPLDSRKAEVPAQERPQWRVVEQGFRRTDQHASEDDCGEPVQAALQHRQAVGPVDLFAVEAAPDPFELSDGDPEASRLAGEYDRIDRAGGRAAEDRKRVHAAMRRHIRDRFQDADLERAARTAARQNERRFDIIRVNFHRFGVL